MSDVTFIGINGYKANCKDIESWSISVLTWEFRSIYPSSCLPEAKFKLVKYTEIS